MLTLLKRLTVLILFGAIVLMSIAQERMLDDYRLTTQRLDSAKYFSLKQAALHSKIVIEKVTDLDLAKKMIGGRVVWGRYDQDSDGIRKDEGGDLACEITFADGKKHSISSEAYFISYYPQEDILLLEGGHTTDISFNLTTGASTEDVGNPDYIIFSPSGKYRLNGHYSGQESSFYFIEKKTEDGYRKVIQLYSPYFKTAFEEQTGIRLYYISNAFWQSDTILNIEASIPDAKGQETMEYYQLSFIGK